MKKLSLIGATALAFLFFAGTTTTCKKKEKELAIANMQMEKN